MNVIVQPQPPIIIKPIPVPPIVIKPVTPGPQGPIGPVGPVGPIGTGTGGGSGIGFIQILPSGVNSHSFSFPTPFSIAPNLQLSMQIPSGSQNLYLYAINYKNVSGFNVEFSEVIQETGCSLNIWCN